MTWKLRPRSLPGRQHLAAGFLFLVASSLPASCFACVGDCGGDGEVTVNELITMVNVALGSAAVDACSVGDANGDGEITINEIIQAVNLALQGCPAGGCELAVVGVDLDFDAGAVPDLAGVTLVVGYPAAQVSLPAESVPDRVFDVSPAGGFLDAALLLGTNPGVRVSYVTPATLPAGEFVEIEFDCVAGSPLPGPSSFTCRVESASDSGGFAVSDVACRTVLLEP